MTDDDAMHILAAATRRQFERNALHAELEDLHEQLEESHVREVRLEAEVKRLHKALRRIQKETDYRGKGKPTWDALCTARRRANQIAGEALREVGR